MSVLSSESEKEYRVLLWLLTRVYNLKFVQTPANCRMCLLPEPHNHGAFRLLQVS